MDEREELRKTFKAKNVGRGVWYSLHSYMSLIMLDRKKKNKSLLLNSLHVFFMMYCESIYCLVCRNHALEFISKNNITRIMSTTRDDRFIEYFRWLYLFHRAANKNAEVKSEAYENVHEHYLVSKIFNDLSYKDIENGMWHLFLLLATKSSIKGYIIALYSFSMDILLNIEEIRDEVNKYILEKKFLSIFTSDSDEDKYGYEFLCFLHELQTMINNKRNIKTYDIDTVSKVYYYLDYCEDDCGK